MASTAAKTASQWLAHGKAWLRQGRATSGAGTNISRARNSLLRNELALGATADWQNRSFPAMFTGLHHRRPLAFYGSEFGKFINDTPRLAQWSISLFDGIAPASLDAGCAAAAAGGYEGPRYFTEAHLWMQLLLLRADAGGPPLPAHSSAFMTSAIVTTHYRVDTGRAGQLTPADAHCSSEGEHRCLIMRR